MNKYSVNTMENTLERGGNDALRKEGMMPQDRYSITDTLMQLDTSLGKDEKRSKDLLHEVRQTLEEHGAHEEDFNTYLHFIAAKYPGVGTNTECVIVRREDPKVLLHAVETGEPINIRFREDIHVGAAYPNASVLGWDASGLRIPYQRGFGKVGTGKIIAVIGFVPNTEKMHVFPLPKGTYAHYSDSVEREKIRMVEGDVFPEDLKFVIFRFPRNVFPKSEMTEAEFENEKVFHISRVYSFEQPQQRKDGH